MATLEFKGLKDILGDIQRMKAEIASATGGVKDLAQAFQGFNQGTGNLQVNGQLGQLRRQLADVQEGMVKSQISGGGNFGEGLQRLVQIRQTQREGNLYSPNFGGAPAPMAPAPVEGIGMSSTRPAGAALPYVSDAQRAQAAMLSGVTGGARVGSLGDVIQAQQVAAKFSGQQGQRDKVLAGLAGQDSLVAQDLVKAMRQNEKNIQALTKTMMGLEEGIKKAEASGDNTRADSLRRRLGAASTSLLSQAEASDDMTRTGGGMGGGGGGGAGSGFFGRMGGFLQRNGAALQVGAAALTAGVGVYQQYRQFDENIQGRYLQAPSDIMRSRASAEMSAYGRYAGLRDPTNGDALLRGSGDILFPSVEGRTAGLGMSGRRAAESEAKERVRADFDLAKTQAITDAIGVGLGMAGTLAGGIVTAGSGGLALPAGAALAAGGAGLAISSANSLETNDFMRSKGGVKGFLSELPLIGGLFEDARSNRTKAAFEEEKKAKIQARITETQDNALQTRDARDFSMGFGMVREGMDIKRGAIGTLGSAARSGFDDMERGRSDKMNNNALMNSLTVTRPEFANMRNLLSGSLMTDGAASAGATADFIKLSRAGVGSAEQLSGNMMALGQAGNRADPTSLLKTVLTDAVALGFTKSAMTQKFVNSVADLSSSMRISSTEMISTALRSGANMMGVGGKADTQSIGLAREGLASYGALTGQTGGMAGVLRASNLFGSGLTMSRGGGALAGMNALQVGSAMEQLKKGKATDFETQNLLVSMGLDVGKGGKISGDTSGIAGKLSSYRDTLNTPALASLQAIISAEGGNYDELVAQAKGSDPKARQKAIARLSSAAQSLKGVDSAAAGTTLVTQAFGITDKRTMRGLDSQIRSGNAALSGDSFYKERVSYMNDLASSAAGKVNGAATDTNVADYFKSGDGNSVLNFQNAKGQTRTATNFADYQKTVKAEGGGINMQSLLVQKQIEASKAEGKSTSTVIENFGPLAKDVLNEVFRGVPPKSGVGGTTQGGTP